MNILALLQCIHPIISKTELKQMSRITKAMIGMTGRVTMLGISRWTEKGGSYRTVQRFFNALLPWQDIFWQFFKAHLYREEHTYILGGDEVVTSKSGKHTYGLDYFFSSLHKKPIKSISAFAFSLIDVEERRSYPLEVVQIIREKVETPQAETDLEEQTVRKPGRPKGSKNRNREEVTLSPYLLWLQSLLFELLERISGLVMVKYLVLDGQFGNKPAVQMAQQLGKHLISRMRGDTALYFPYTGEYAGRGAPRKYGDRIVYENIPPDYLVRRQVEDSMETCIYQVPALHKNFSGKLNVVILTKRDIQDNSFAHVIFFSSDLELDAETMIDYYALRFQIEFNFRDAKQHWGMEDFMNIKEVPVTNTLNLSLFMVNLSQVLLADFQQQTVPESGILDLKAYFRAARYFEELLKLLPQNAEVIFNPPKPGSFLPLGCIHYQKAPINPP